MPVIIKPSVAVKQAIKKYLDWTFLFWFIYLFFGSVHSSLGRQYRDL